MKLNKIPSPLRMQSKGAALVEYAITVAMISILAIGVVLQLGTEIQTVFSSTSSTLETKMETVATGDDESDPAPPASSIQSWSVAIDDNPDGMETVTGTDADDQLTVSYSDINNIATDSVLMSLDFLPGAGANTIIMSGFDYADPVEACFTGQARVYKFGPTDYEIIVCNDDGDIGVLTIFGMGAIDEVIFDNVTVDTDTL